MIDPRFELKYSFPHSVVHIVDNSMYTGALPVKIVDDPSLYATIVVTGCNIGADNVVTALNRSDVANVAYGLGSVTSTDRKKYGQCIDYATSLIDQGAPVRFMRVTPDDATYGFSCVVVQWRIDTKDNLMHVRYKTKGIPDSIILDKFANVDRLNTALVNAYKSNDIGDGWKQRVLITNISAGRGAAYNNYATAIDIVPGLKNPANVAYIFSTIDTRTSTTPEVFTASLVNIDNNRYDAIDSVNISVGRRVEGSSIIKPIVNESAVNELYKEYRYHLENNVNTTFDENVLTSLNINTFDMLYGNYIYNGDIDTPLPYYQVDMVDTSVPKLSVDNRLSTDGETFNDNMPVVLHEELLTKSYGLTNIGDSVYVGDVFLYANNNNSLKPQLAIVAGINQYTGAVTTLSIPKVYNTFKDNGCVDTSDHEKTNVIAATFNDIAIPATVGSEDYTTSPTISKLVRNGDIIANSVIAYVNDGFKLFLVKTANIETGVYTVQEYTVGNVYRSLYWAGNPASTTGCGNVIGGITQFGGANNKPGSLQFVYDSTKDNDAGLRLFMQSFEGDGRYVLNNTSLRYGVPPTDVNIVNDIVGESYDVMAQTADGRVLSATIVTPGSGYAIGDTITVVGFQKENKGDDIDLEFTIVDVPVSGVKVIATEETKQYIIDNLASYLGSSTKFTVDSTSGSGTGMEVSFANSDVKITSDIATSQIVRYTVSGVQGSLFRAQKEDVVVPANYYSDEHGVNMSAELGGINIEYGSTGFFDDESIDEIEFKWRYSALLVKAYRGYIDPRIMSPSRVPAKFLFDAGHNTLVGQTILPYMTYEPADIINASTIFTAEEKETVLFNPETIDSITTFEDIDVKQAMYDLMIYRCYDGIPENMRPVGPGSGLQLNLDSGITDASTSILINTSFVRRFDNPNAVWDIGGWVSSVDGMSYTFTKKLVDGLIKHCKDTSINKPYTHKFTKITKDEYISYFPDIDKTDHDLRELLYNSGGNAWVADINGNLIRSSQRTLMRSIDTSNGKTNNVSTSDIIQESNMRTLSQFTYLLQNTVDDFLLAYSDDNSGTIKTLSDLVNNKFSNWVGNLVEALDITFQKDINTDGGDILVCYANLTFRGLILRVPIICNINRRV